MNIIVVHYYSHHYWNTFTSLLRHRQLNQLMLYFPLIFGSLEWEFDKCSIFKGYWDIFDKKRNPNNSIEMICMQGYYDPNRVNKFEKSVLNLRIILLYIKDRFQCIIIFFKCIHFTVFLSWIKQNNPERDAVQFTNMERCSFLCISENCRLTLEFLTMMGTNPKYVYRWRAHIFFFSKSMYNST